MLPGRTVITLLCGLLEALDRCDRTRRNYVNRYVVEPGPVLCLQEHLRTGGLCDIIGEGRRRDMQVRGYRNDPPPFCSYIAGSTRGKR